MPRRREYGRRMPFSSVYVLASFGFGAGSSPLPITAPLFSRMWWMAWAALDVSKRTVAFRRAQCPQGGFQCVRSGNGYPTVQGVPD